MSRTYWDNNSIQEYLNKHYNGFKLTTSYSEDREKINIMCPKGHINYTKWSRFRISKNKCKECKTNLIDDAMKKRFNATVEQEEYKLIGYVDRRRALIKCNNKDHSEYEVEFNNFFNGQRCKMCRNEQLSKLKRHSYDYVKDTIEKDGYKLLSAKYINNKLPLSIKCNNSHIYETPFDNWTQGKRCPVCSGTMKHSYEHVKSVIEGIGFALISRAYINNREKLTLICDKNHAIEMAFGDIVSGRRCGKCRYDNMSREGHWNWKGGKLPLSHSLRNATDYWRKECIEQANFRCEITGHAGILEVHHKIPFNTIINNSLKDLGLDRRDHLKDYSIQDQGTILNKIRHYHDENIEIGAPLLKEVHLLFHQTFSFFDNTPEQYSFFKDNYQEILAGDITAEDFYVLNNNIEKSGE